MAYRSQINTRQRSAAFFAVILIHAGLLLGLFNLSRKIDLGNPESVLRTIDLRQLLPPPPPKQNRPRTVQKAAKAGSAPKNIVNEATPVVATKTAINPEPTVVASTMPRQGASPNQGASPQSVPGSGSGGTGTGTRTGSGGEVVEPPQLASPVLGGRDFSIDMLDSWPRGATIFLRLRIDPGGKVAECLVDRRSGVAAIDGTICNLAHDRLRFRPALDRSGQAVAGWFGYAQPAPR